MAVWKIDASDPGLVKFNINDTDLTGVIAGATVTILPGQLPQLHLQSVGPGVLEAIGDVVFDAPPTDTLLLILDMIDSDELEELAMKSSDFGTTTGAVFLAAVKELVQRRAS